MPVHVQRYVGDTLKDACMFKYTWGWTEASIRICSSIAIYPICFKCSLSVNTGLTSSGNLNGQGFQAFSCLSLHSTGTTNMQHYTFF